MVRHITIGREQAAAAASVFLPENQSAINVGMSVSDNRLRSLGIETDGLERPFVLVPRNGEWKRYDLQYGGSYSNRGSSEVRDSYNLHLSLASEGLNASEIQAHGVAFGLDVSGANGRNPSTVWLQSFEDNYRP